MRAFEGDMITSRSVESELDLEAGCRDEAPEETQTLLLYPSKLLDQAKGGVVQVYLRQ